MTVFKRVFGAAALLAAIGGPAAPQGDPRPGLLDIVTVDRVAETVASFAISALRTQMEVEYDHLSTDILRGTMAISGVTLRPQLSHDRARQCEITVQRASFDLGTARPMLEAANGSVTLVGARAGIACLPPDAGLALRASGYSTLDIDRVGLEFDYIHGTGEMRVNGTAAINDMGTLDLAAAGAILPRLNAHGVSGDPAIRLRRAVVGFQDRGAWSRLSSQLPEALRQPDVIRGMGTEDLTNMLSENGTRALTSTERLFIEDLMEHVTRFVADPGEITIEAQLPAGGIVIEPEIYQNPPELLQALAPDARVAPSARSGLIDVALLQKREEEVTPQDRLRLARAFMEGQGVPRAEALVPGVLEPILDAEGETGAEAALLTARAYMATNPAEAYRHALLASARDAVGAVALLDALEARLTTGAVLAAQDELANRTDAPEMAEALPEGGDIRAVRALALAHLNGIGALRSYPRAYYYALIAEAAGDIGAGALRQDIEARFADRGEAVSAQWAELRARLQERAVDDWVTLDLSDRFIRTD
ncbi:hypothetical protein K1T73_03090 [Roseovarius sp. SCSIO 43702]|uniref:hypothetical protein n=1 Tax=Roseovarius sp. SCSIO 43702 TaxID=2823043 RepID=UPI001C72A04E|nr:hypothetical protein [Roseovarius sp. SCSIO 43702]QYX57402.1 hypothetical protein K1T73_03090 [Roseovarius sp. SCSIO 43702]